MLPRKMARTVEGQHHPIWKYLQTEIPVSSPLKISLRSCKQGWCYNPAPSFDIRIDGIKELN